MLYRNGYMNQERQIQDIRSFIVYQVDAIVFTPIQENNWEPILEEAARGFPFSWWTVMSTSAIPPCF